MVKTLGEFTPSKAIVFLMPYRNDIWRDNCRPAQDMIIELANAVAPYERVILGVVKEIKEDILSRYKFHKNVELIEMKYNDCWPRDSISNVVFDENNKPFIYSYHFNSYGDGLYRPWDDDDALDEEIAKLFSYPLKQSPLTLEGGNMVSDGEGTLFVVEDALVNDNRNKGLSKEFIEESLKESTGCKQIVWIKYGLDFDETGGHIDNIIAFADSKTMLLSWTDDKNNHHYERVREIQKQLEGITNLKGEKYHVVRVPVAPITYRSEEDCRGIVIKDSSFAREVGDPVLNTYINIIIANGVIVVPKYDIPLDKEAYEVMKKVFPNREIIQIDAKEASLGGGGFHCLSKHIN